MLRVIKLRVSPLNLLYPKNEPTTLRINFISLVNYRGVLPNNLPVHSLSLDQAVPLKKPKGFETHNSKTSCYQLCFTLQKKNTSHRIRKKRRLQQNHERSYELHMKRQSPIALITRARASSLVEIRQDCVFSNTGNISSLQLSHKLPSLVTIFILHILVPMCYTR